MLIRKQRLQRAWSQEHLAALVGVNVRTIQRIERGAKPGLETAKALAAVFEVSPTTFQREESIMQNPTGEPEHSPGNDNAGAHSRQPPPDNSAPGAESADQTTATSVTREERDALNYVKGLREFWSHFIIYLVFLITFLVCVDLNNPMVRWGMPFWGVGLTIHALAAFEIINFLSPTWERRHVEKRLGRKL